MELSAKILNDFILHIGQNEGRDSCALIRIPGEEWISAGQVTTTATPQGRWNVEIITDERRLLLPSVTERHVQLIREQGLYVIQRKASEQGPEACLLEWKAC
jgi:hypothetical protein